MLKTRIQLLNIKLSGDSLYILNMHLPDTQNLNLLSTFPPPSCRNDAFETQNWFALTLHFEKYPRLKVHDQTWALSQISCSA